MGNTSQKLNKIIETKAAIKAALINKNVNINDDTKFSEYPALIESIEAGSGSGTADDFYNIVTENGTNFYQLFQRKTMESLDLSGWDTSQVTNMSYMFSNCSKLATVDLSGWNTSQVTNISYMFQSCSKLETITGLSNFNMSKVNDIRYMFSGCSSLTTIDISSWDMSQVNDIDSIFSNCKALETITGLSNLDKSKVIRAHNMFSGCSSLKSLDLSSWYFTPTSVVYYMFQDCTSLETLDIRNFDMTNNTYPFNIFDGCTSLYTIRLDNCNAATISCVISEDAALPINAIAGKTRTIYCKESEAVGLTPPTNWVFSYV